MNRITLTLVILIYPVFVQAQENFGFPFGKISYAELDAKSIPADTSAEAYVIKELAEAHVDYETNNKIIFTYHVKIKILKQSGSDRGDINVSLKKGSGSSRKDEIRDVQASAFNIVNNKIEETKMDSKSLFVERNGKRQYDEAKFAIPNVRAGTVIEYQYVIVSPFLYNFKKWEFQTDIPKIYSEYRTVIPGNYSYNVTLRGYLNLTEKKDDIIQGCIHAGNGASAACATTRYVMKDIPAFREEEYMTAKENYLSAINFELSEVRDWDGRVNKFTKEWKDADEELRLDENFGQQLRKNRDAFEDRIGLPVLSEADPLIKAKKVYDYVKYAMIWSEYFGAYTDVGIKKALEQKQGNVADINLGLVAALRYAGLDAEPVMLATRHIERPIEIHPVLNDFNYVIAKLNLGDKVYLLDATDQTLPFGLISEYCYNGKGRVITEKGSYWMELKPTDRNRVVTQVNLKLSNEGVMNGTITHSYYGYAGVDRRKHILAFSDEKSYLQDVRAKNHTMEISSYNRKMEDDLSRPIVETFTVEIPAFDTPVTTHFLFSPFFNGKLEINPFKTETRNFPVDYGVPMERNLIVSVEYPDNVEITSLPDKKGIALPNAGGRYIYAVQNDGGKLVINNLLSIARPIFSPEEYPYLRELYAQRIQAESADIIFQRKGK
jgi:transglutaminase-like putative cysteine protease